MKVAGLLLAAGRGSRFGSDKLLATLDGVPVARSMWDRLCEAGLSDLVIVSRDTADGLRAALAPAPSVQWIENPCADQGMSSSLRAGVAALPDTVDGVIVALADMPAVQTSTLLALCAAFVPGDCAVVPVFAGKRGNPVLVARALFPAVAALHGDTGAKSILAAHADCVRDIDVDDPGIHLDVDTKEDLSLLLQTYAVGGK